MSETAPASFLVVDDHAPFRSALARALREFGVVAHAASAAEGREAIAAGSWAALFIDVSLPDGNGLDVLAFARATGCTAPAIVLTASHDPATINRAFHYGARILVKPGSWPDIADFVRSALTTSARLRDVAQRWAETYELSPSETAILVATAEGASRDQVIEEREIARATFKRHVVNLLAKTGDPSLLRAAMRLLRELDSPSA